MWCCGEEGRITAASPSTARSEREEAADARGTCPDRNHARAFTHACVRVHPNPLHNDTARVRVRVRLRVRLRVCARARLEEAVVEEAREVPRELVVLLKADADALGQALRVREVLRTDREEGADTETDMWADMRRRTKGSRSCGLAPGLWGRGRRRSGGAVNMQSRACSTAQRRWRSAREERAAQRSRP